MWWSYAALAFLVMRCIEQVVDRQHLRARRAASRRSRDELGALEKPDRREVVRAVRAGRAVADPRLAPAAVAFATNVLATGESRPFRWLNSFLGLVLFSAPAAVAAGRQRWALAAVLALWPLAIVSLFAFTLKLKSGAGDALAVNQGLIGRPASSAPDTPWAR